MSRYTAARTTVGSTNKTTTNKKTAAKHIENLRPKIHFIVADDVRVEEGGKLVAVGIYLDRVVVAQSEADFVPSASEPMVLEGLSLGINVRGVSGEHCFEIAFKAGADGQRMSLGEQSHTIKSGSSLNLVVKLRPFITHSYGVKTVEVLIDGQPFPLEFEIKKGPPSPKRVKAKSNS
jgi:hypothetical protein